MLHIEPTTAVLTAGGGSDSINTVVPTICPHPIFLTYHVLMTCLLVGCVLLHLYLRDRLILQPVRQRARRIKEIQVYFASARAMPLRAGLVVLDFFLSKTSNTVFNSYNLIYKISAN